MTLPAAKTSSSSGRTEVAGYDASYTKPDPAAMARAGYQFVVGYVSPTSGKNLSAAQVSAARGAGLAVGLVWESTAGRAVTGGTAGGTTDGASADAQANAVGYPTTSVLFIAVDQDTTSANYPAIQAYADAFKAHTSRPVGIYGEADVVDHFVGTASVSYGWQTAAWSGGRVSAKAALYQRVGHPYWPVPSGVSSSAFDEDVALHDVPLMGWVGSAPPPPPPSGTKPPVFPAFPYPTDQWFGIMSDPNPKSHGGDVASEQPYVKHIQQAMAYGGWYGAGVQWTDSSVVDGLYGQKTFDAVAKWQGAYRPGTQFWGAVWAADWAAMSAQYTA